MTLNGRYALHGSNNASFRARHKNINNKKQRNSASVAHVYLGWLIGREQCTEHRRIADVVQPHSQIVSTVFDSISHESVRHTWPMKFSNIIYPQASFKIMDEHRGYSARIMSVGGATLDGAGSKYQWVCQSSEDTLNSSKRFRLKNASKLFLRSIIHQTT